MLVSLMVGIFCGGVRVAARRFALLLYAVHRPKSSSWVTFLTLSQLVGSRALAYGSKLSMCCQSCNQHLRVWKLWNESGITYTDSVMCNKATFSPHLIWISYCRPNRLHNVQERLAQSPANLTFCSPFPSHLGSLYDDAKCGALIPPARHDGGNQCGGGNWR